MARLTKTCLCLLSLIPAVVPCVGQQDTPPPVKRELDYIRSESEWVVETAGKAKISFNQGTKRKRAYVELLKVTDVPGRGIDVTFWFAYERRAVKPLWFNIEFTADTESFGNVPGHAVVVESDGQKLDLGKVFAGEPTAKDASRLILKKTMLYDSFVRALGGKQVRVRLGSFSFQLGEAELAAVHDLIKLTETH